MMLKKKFPAFLKIAVMPDRFKLIPWLFQTEGNQTQNITDAPLIKLLSEVLKFKFELLPTIDGTYGNLLPGGNWSGIIGMVHRKEADIGVAKLSVTETRASAVAFSNPYQQIPITFVTDKPKYLPNKYAVLHAFGFSVWMAIIFSLIAVQCLSLIFKSKGCYFKSSWLHFYGSLLQQSVSFKILKTSAKLFTLSWVFGAMLVAEFYKADLLSFLTFPTMIGIRNVEELSKACQKTSFMCSAYGRTKVYSDVFESGRGTWRNIRECLIRSNAYTDEVEAFLKPSSYQKAFIGWNHHLKSFRLNYFVSQDLFYSDLIGIAVEKSFCCKGLLDKVITKIGSVGILDKFDRDEAFFFKIRDSYVDGEKTRKQLSLDDVSGAFIFLILGHVLATAFLLVEILFWKAKEVKGKRRNLRMLRKIQTYRVKISPSCTTDS